MENNIKKGLKPEQRQELKKYAVFALMFLAFGLFLSQTKMIK